MKRINKRGIKKKAVYFTVGGVGYGILEIIWRGHTHWTMIIAGGVCLVMFSCLSERLCRRSLICKAAVGALGVTAVEFIFGVIFNLLLKMDVWDYSDKPFNVLGQICPAFSAGWLALALVLMPAVAWVDGKIKL